MQAVKAVRPANTRESYADHGLSTVDLFAWGIFRRHERGDTEWYNEFSSKVLLDEQYP